VNVGQFAVEEVGEDLRLTRAEYFFGDLAAGREAGPRQGLLPPPARQLELELGFRVGEHDEPALGPGDFNRRIQYQREHIVQHAAAAEGAQAVEKGRDLAEVADGGGRRLVLGRTVGQEEDQLGAPGAPQADAVAVHQRPIAGDGLVVDEGAVAGLLVPDEETAAGGHDFGVVPGDLAAGQAQVVGLPPADAERFLGDWHDSPAEGVGDFQAGIWHWRVNLIKKARRARGISTMTVTRRGAVCWRRRAAEAAALTHPRYS
jgi:hypothetical protein